MVNGRQKLKERIRGQERKREHENKNTSEKKEKTAGGRNRWKT